MAQAKGSLIPAAAALKEAKSRAAAPRPSSKKASTGRQGSGFTQAQHEVTRAGGFLLFVFIVHQQIGKYRHRFPGQQKGNNVAGRQEEDQGGEEKMVIDAE